jgi:hypothetical protein
VVEKPAYNILMIGPSHLTYTEADESAAMYGLLEAELRRRHPEASWACTGELVFAGDEMAERASRAADRVRPDAVIVRLSSRHLSREFVIWAFRRRFPKLYPLATYIDRRLIRLAGGAHDAANTRHRMVWTLARGLALKAVGASTAMSAEEAIANTVETLARLKAREDIFLYCWISSSARTQKARNTPQMEEDVNSYWKAVLGYLDQHHIPYADSNEMRSVYGGEKKKAADGIHSDRASREVRAFYFADVVEEALGIASATEARTGTSAAENVSSRT